MESFYDSLHPGDLIYVRVVLMPPTPFQNRLALCRILSKDKRITERGDTHYDFSCRIIQQWFPGYGPIAWFRKRLKIGVTLGLVFSGMWHIYSVKDFEHTHKAVRESRIERDRIREKRQKTIHKLLKRKKTPDKTKCPICGGQITRERWAGHANMGELPHGHFFEAWCESCHIVLYRDIFGKHDTGWLSSKVNRQDVVGELSQEELDCIDKKLARDSSIYYAEWKEFIVQKQETDLVCRFKKKDYPYTGLTIKRGDYLIGSFLVFENL
jgi:hypothetical protein